ncbi:hypothetical protein D3C76_1149070 [compost metagenome]
MLGIARFQRALVGVQALVLRQQGRVDVQQAALIVADEARREDAHEAGEQHQVGIEAVDGLDQRGIEAFAVGIRLVIEEARLDAGLAGTLEAEGIRAVGDHRADGGRRFSAGEAVDQGLQVAAGTGDQHHYIARMGHQCAFRLFRTTRSASAAQLSMRPMTHGCSPASRRAFSAAST